MGYAVLHLDKSLGSESAMTDHIERNKIHLNVDSNRVHLNKELIEFPEGVNDRTEAIQYRLKTAGLTRKVGKNQVQVIRFMLSGSSEDMERIQNEGKLNDWCKDNIDWLQKTFGKENVVAATLHMDEKTPHIHASVVPIVRGERRQKPPRKQKTEQEQTEKPKRKYKKKDPNRVRLCCDDVMAKAKLIEYQDSYGEAMSKYGLTRGEKGSVARHISLTEYYRNQMVESKNLQENIELLLAVEDAKRLSIEELKQQEQDAQNKTQQAELIKTQKTEELKEAEESLHQVKGQLKTEKLKNTAADVGSSIIEGIGSMIGSSKVKLQQKEIDELKAENEHLKGEIAEQHLHMQTIRTEHETILSKLNQELSKIYDLFPSIKELLRIENLCKAIGFSEKLIRMILKEDPVGFKGKLYSPEHDRKFETSHSEAQIRKHPDNPSKLQLMIDGKIHIDWFRDKKERMLEEIKLKVKPQRENRGIKM